jgi:electron transport complex protein RnfG
MKFEQKCLILLCQLFKNSKTYLSEKLSPHKPLVLAILLGGMTLAGISLVSLVFYLSKNTIAQNQRSAVLHNLQQVLPVSLYDNDIVNDTLQITAPEIDDTSSTTVYRARRQGTPVAVVITSSAPDGYNGKINLLVAIKVNGVLAGVRVISHQETPGLGDKIEQNRSDWILRFQEQSLAKLGLSQWTVKRDGGHFDEFSGATITPRAVVKAVKNTLLYYQSHQAELF